MGSVSIGVADVGASMEYITVSTIKASLGSETTPEDSPPLPRGVQGAPRRDTSLYFL